MELETNDADSQRGGRTRGGWFAGNGSSRRTGESERTVGRNDQRVVGDAGGVNGVHNGGGSRIRIFRCAFSLSGKSNEGSGNDVNERMRVMKREDYWRWRLL